MEGVKGWAKKVLLVCEAFVVDQVMQLPTCPEQEVSSQSNRYQPPEVEFFPVPVPQGAQGERDGGAARQKTDAVQNRQIENLPRSWATEILSQIIQVGHDEDGEDGSFRDDQAGHAHDAFGGAPVGA